MVVVVMEAVVVVEAVAAVTLLSLGVVQIRPDERSNISVLSAVEVVHMPQSVCVNDEASTNMSSMLVTLDTSHLERSRLNDDAEASMPIMLVTLETSHLKMPLLNLLAL